jgi:hypothetical protein
MNDIMVIIKDSKRAIEALSLQFEQIVRTIDSLTFNHDNLTQEFNVLKERLRKIEHPGDP